MATNRHLKPGLVVALAISLLLAGVAIAGFAFVPLADLLTPVVATAFMLHIFQGLPAVKGLLRTPAVR